MDTRSGRIYSAEEVRAVPEADRPYLDEMAIDPTPAQWASRTVGRNHPCPCGSRRKFKRCCLGRPARG